MTGFGAWGMPGGGFNWNMLTGVGAGMLANSEYGPAQAFGKGYNQAAQTAMDQSKQQLLFNEYERKRKAEEEQAKFRTSLMNQLGAAQQPAPTAGGQLGGMQFAPDSDEGAYAAALGTAPQQQPQMPQSGGMNVMGLNVSPQQAANAKIWLAQGNTEEAIKSLTGGDPNLTGEIKEFMLARQQGYRGTFMDYKKELKAGTNVTVNNQGENAFLKEGASVLAKQYGEDAAAGRKAQETRGQLEFLKEYAGNLKHGTGAQAMLAERFGPWLEMAGIKVEDLGTMQGYRSLVNKMAPGLRAAGSGNTSDRDIMLFLNSLPNLMNTPEGNQMVSETLEAVAMHQQQRGEIAEEALATGDYKAAREKMKALPDPYQLWKSSPEYAESKKAKAAPEQGVQGGGSTTPNPSNAPAEWNYDPKTKKRTRVMGDQSGWFNPGEATMGYSGGLRG